MPEMIWTMKKKSVSPPKIYQNECLCWGTRLRRRNPVISFHAIRSPIHSPTPPPPFVFIASSGLGNVDIVFLDIDPERRQRRARRSADVLAIEIEQAVVAIAMETVHRRLVADCAAKMGTLSAERFDLAVRLSQDDHRLIKILEYLSRVQRDIVDFSHR